MTAFDTDVLTEVLQGNDKYGSRALAIAPAEQAIPVPVLEEIMRGRLNGIRLAETRKGTITIERAYELFARTFTALRNVQLLDYTKAAEEKFQAWRRRRVRVSTLDLRIAAICVTYHATLISRNRRDFERVPGLVVEFWD